MAFQDYFCSCSMHSIVLEEFDAVFGIDSEGKRNEATGEAASAQS